MEHRLGSGALSTNSTGTQNVAVGYGTLESIAAGLGNTAVGRSALGQGTTGQQNTAIGLSALVDTTGSNNIGIGAGGGFSLTTGSNNIDIYDPGISGESNTIRVGTQGTQMTTFIAGISGTTVTGGATVLINSSGQLGTIVSSARYKRDIHDMGDASDQLMRLRPVIFRYKADPSATQQYGLIAEEVAKVYPDLVVNDRDGKPQTVAYQELPAILLNEVQRQARQLAEKDAQITSLEHRLAAVEEKNLEIDALTARLDSIEHQVRAQSSTERLAASTH